MNNVHFLSTTDEWATPPDLFAAMNVIFKFTLDVCADWTNAKCAEFYTKMTDGLVQDWAKKVGPGGAVWMNPPYGREIGKWIAKADEESRKGCAVVCLLPSRTDTRWWHEHIQPILDGTRRGAVNFLRGRLKFGGCKNSAPFPSVIVIFRPEK